MGFKVGQEVFIPISNSKKIGKEKELQKYDTNHDNMLDKAEAAKYYADKTGGKTPASSDDIYGLVGGRDHKITQFDRDYYSTLYTYAPDFKGNFNIPGFGAGNVHTGRQLGPNNTEAFNFLVDCDLMDRNLVDNKLESATIVIGPKGFKPETGSKLDEMVTIPLSSASADGYSTFDRGGGSHWVPEKKYLAASVDVKSLKNLAGKSGGLSYYVRLQTTDGQTLWINRDGKAFNNFEIDASELKARGKV
jgi:hypothetical protein